MFGEEVSQEEREDRRKTKNQESEGQKILNVRGCEKDWERGTGGKERQLDKELSAPHMLSEGREIKRYAACRCYY